MLHPKIRCIFSMTPSCYVLYNGNFYKSVVCCRWRVLSSPNPGAAPEVFPYGHSFMLNGTVMKKMSPYRTRTQTSIPWRLSFRSLFHLTPCSCWGFFSLKATLIFFFLLLPQKSLARAVWYALLEPRFNAKWQVESMDFSPATASWVILPL